MKRVLLTVALCVAASSASFAQKKAVKEAQGIAKGDKADFTEARALIKERWKIRKLKMTLKLGM